MRPPASVKMMGSSLASRIACSCTAASTANAFCIPAKILSAPYTRRERFEPRPWLSIARSAGGAYRELTVASHMNGGTGHFHAVRFYEDAEALSRIVGGFLAEGFLASQPAVVIATPKHRAAIEARLADRSFDIDQLKRDA